MGSSALLGRLGTLGQGEVARTTRRVRVFVEGRAGRGRKTESQEVRTGLGAKIGRGHRGWDMTRKGAVVQRVCRTCRVNRLGLWHLARWAVVQTCFLGHGRPYGLRAKSESRCRSQDISLFLCHVVRFRRKGTIRKQATQPDGWPRGPCSERRVLQLWLRSLCWGCISSRVRGENYWACRTVTVLPKVLGHARGRTWACWETCSRPWCITVSRQDVTGLGWAVRETSGCFTRACWCMLGAVELWMGKGGGWPPRTRWAFGPI